MFVTKIVVVDLHFSHLCHLISILNFTEIQ